MTKLAERISTYCSTHPWAYLFAWPFLLVYIIWQIPKALGEWGKGTDG